MSNQAEAIEVSEAVEPSSAEQSTKQSPVTLFGENRAAQISLLIAGFCSLLIFFVLNFPREYSWLLFADNTPTGGDMGAHVWGPAFMRDNLLSGGGLTGWTNDWYQGFPAYRFYMVIPALAIILLNAGFSFWFGLPLAIAILAGLFVLSRSTSQGRLATIVSKYKVLVVALAAICALGLVSLPYGVAFKLVAVSGIVSMPLSAWGMGKLARAPEPIPGLLALGVTVFVFDTNFTILGGNILSTLAGEFSFSISLSLVLLAIGMTIRAIDDRRWIGRTAIVVALAALSHIIPLFFMVPALVYSLFVKPAYGRLVAVFGAVGIFVPAILINEDYSTRDRALWAGLFMVVIVSLSVLLWPKLSKNVNNFLRDFWTLTVVGIVSVALASFWLVPFLVSGEIYGMFNDMGWERLENVGEMLLTVPMRIGIVGAVIAAVLALAGKSRLGLLFTTMSGFTALLVANLGHGALWNQRILPFFYLSIYLSCAVGIALLIHVVVAKAKEFADPNDFKLQSILTLSTFLVVLTGVLVPLNLAPFASYSYDEEGERIYELAVFDLTMSSSVQGWAAWNFSGYEGKDSYREYRDIVETMDSIGSDRGCGRAMWEFDSELDRYGTPMALMLLPFWTDGCIASMEGLFFESSASTPFHFLNQSVLSEAPSRAQRDLPYKEFDIDVGVAQLQASGVKYYMALSDKAITAARGHEDLVEIDSFSVRDSGETEIAVEAFEIFEVLDSSQVVGLDYLPVVVEGANLRDLYDDSDGQTEDRAEIEDAITERSDALTSKGVPDDIVSAQLRDLRIDLIEKLERQSEFRRDWVGEAVKYYSDPTAYPALPAVDGPDDWPVADGDELVDRELPSEDGSTGVTDKLVEVDDPASVTDLEVTDSTISFTVDQIGKPVLVKTSYFPNWNATGADGPYRAGPNQMVVIPTSEQVELSYDASLVERLSSAAAFLALLAILGTYIRRRRNSATEDEVSEPIEEPVSEIGVTVDPKTTGNITAVVSNTDPQVDVPTTNSLVDSEQVLQETEPTSASEKEVSDPSPSTEDEVD